MRQSRRRGREMAVRPASVARLKLESQEIKSLGLMCADYLKAGHVKNAKSNALKRNHTVPIASNKERLAIIV